MSDSILIERHGAVSVIRLNDPSTLNALTVQMAQDLRAMLRSEAESGAEGHS